MKIIDAHVHLVQCICGTGSRGAMRACGQGRGMYDDGTVYQLIPPELGEDSVTPEAALRVMDAHGVEKAVLLQGNFVGFQNLYSYEAQQRYPDRFLAAAAYDPFSRNRQEILEHLFEKLQMRVVKFEVSTGSGLMANHPTIPLDGDVMEREYAYADDHNLIFVIDIGKLGSESSQIPALRRAILRHPSMRFVVCHLLSPKASQEKEMVEGLTQLALPNVWFDLASIQNNVKPDPAPYPVSRRFIHAAADTVGADRLIFGTDLPSNLCNFTYQSMIETVTLAPGFTDEEKQLMMYGNAERVFWGRGEEI